MEKIKKIGTGFLLVLGFIAVLGIGTVKVMPMVSNLMVDAVSLIPTPQLDNPVPQCSECVVTRGLAPKCVNVCLQEVILKNYAAKPYLQCLAGQ